MTDRPALLLIGHGSRDGGGVAQCRELVEGARSATAPDLLVGCGFLEFAEPPLDHAVDDLVASGAGHIVAVPLVLLGAGHLKDDGPAALARARRRHPGVRFSYGRELGVHPTLLSAAEQRAASLVGAGPRHDWAVALVGRGSTDPDANADLFKVARLVHDGRGFSLVEAGFVSLASPSVPETLERCRRLGARRIAVVPYFLFTGVLVARIRRQAEEWARAHPDVEVRCSDELGPEPALVQLVLDRFSEALSGQARMNCDACAYRLPLPGYEAKAGRPLALDGHGHPAHHVHHHALEGR